MCKTSNAQPGLDETSYFVGLQKLGRFQLMHPRWRGTVTELVFKSTEQNMTDR